MKRNLKNINHWIAEFRDIAYKAKLYSEDGEIEISKEDRKYLFNKSDFEDRFKDGLAPHEAFVDEMENWMDNQ